MCHTVFLSPNSHDLKLFYKPFVAVKFQNYLVGLLVSLENSDGPSGLWEWCQVMLKYGGVAV